MRTMTLTLLAGCTALLLAGGVRADEVFFRSGATVKGEVTTAQGKIHISTADGVLTVSSDRVARIRRSGARRAGPVSARSEGAPQAGATQVRNPRPVRVIPEPRVDTIADTRSLGVRPTVSADRRYVTLGFSSTRTRVLGFDEVPVHTGVRPADQEARGGRAKAGGGNPGGAPRALEQPVSVDFDDAQLSEVIQFLGQVADVGFAYRNVDLAAQPTVTLHLDDVPLRQVLDLLVEGTDLSWTAVYGIIRIAPAREVRRLRTGRYEVRDRVVYMADYGQVRTPTLAEARGDEEDDGDEEAWGAGGFGWEEADEDEEGRWGGGAGRGPQDLSSRVFDLATLITRTVRPESWDRPAVGMAGGPEEEEEEEEEYGAEVWE